MKKELHVGETWKNAIWKSDFFNKIYRHVRHSLILICTLMSSIEKIDQHFANMFKKISFLQHVIMVNFTCWCTMGETKKNFFKISKILPTGNSFMKTENHIDLTYWWNRWFFTKNDQISLDSPIGEKSKFYSPPPHTGVQFDFFFQNKRIINGKKSK